MRHNFTLEDMGAAHHYQAFLDYIFEVSARCSVVCREHVELSMAGRTFLSDNDNALIERAQVSSWPGTTLLGGFATGYTFRTTESFQRSFRTAADSLVSWLHPGLPEDPAFFRPDGSLILGTVTHEADAFLCLDPAEAADFVNRLPSLRLATE